MKLIYIPESSRVAVVSMGGMAAWHAEAAMAFYTILIPLARLLASVATRTSRTEALEHAKISSNIHTGGCVKFYIWNSYSFLNNMITYLNA